MIKIDAIAHNQALFQEFPFRELMDYGKKYSPKLFKFFEDFILMMEPAESSQKSDVSDN